MTPYSPEIARLRWWVDESLSNEAHVAVTDLRYALALIDESCKSCAFVEEIKKQGQRLDRMYDLFDEVMREHRRERATPASGVVELRTCQHGHESSAGKPHCPDCWHGYGTGV